MRPNTNKPKTAKAGRRFRGLEVAQAALLLVLGVVTAMAMYFVMMNIMQAMPVPDVQLNPYYSYVNPNGNWGIVALKFGKTGVVTRVWVDSSTGALIAECTPGFWKGGTLPTTVNAGQEYNFYCELLSGAVWDKRMTVRVAFADGRIANFPWVIG